MHIEALQIYPEERAYSIKSIFLPVNAVTIEMSVHSKMLPHYKTFTMLLRNAGIPLFSCSVVTIKVVLHEFYDNYPNTPTTFFCCLSYRYQNKVPVFWAATARFNKAIEMLRNARVVIHA